MIENVIRHLFKCVGMEYGCINTKDAISFNPVNFSIFQQISEKNENYSKIKFNYILTRYLPILFVPDE